MIKFIILGEMLSGIIRHQSLRGRYLEKGTYSQFFSHVLRRYWSFILLYSLVSQLWYKLICILRSWLNYSAIIIFTVHIHLAFSGISSFHVLSHTACGRKSQPQLNGLSHYPGVGFLLRIKSLAETSTCFVGERLVLMSCHVMSCFEGEGKDLFKCHWLVAHVCRG